ncbi:MAG TPA: tetratricopeptide repeat protein [Polyangiaceae bacterium]
MSRLRFSALVAIGAFAVVPAAHSQAPKPAASASAAVTASPAPTARASAAPPVATAPATVQAPKATTGTGSAAARAKAKASAQPPPTPAQLRAFQLLNEEARTYEKDSKDYRRLMTMVVRHHYESRRKRVLQSLDREIQIEKYGLENARNEAISRLEEFVARYSGTNSDRQATPDAMFRLAALYEERARERTEGDIATGLEPAIALYRRLIREYPEYEELAAVHYYLGHTLTDSGRIDEGQQAWHVLVCQNRYKILDDPKDAGKILVEPLPQDHDPKFWDEWSNKHPIPLDQDRQVRRPAPAKAKTARAGTPKPGSVDAEELTYVDPYDGCTPIPQPTIAPGEDPRYVAEVWWQVGNYHFDQIDPRGGPYNLNRAVTAYERSMEWKKPPIFGVSMYKRAWSFFKQQRYHAAVNEFVRLLHYADEQEAKTGDPGADFRAEAYTYIAGSLTYVDFEGPPPEHPYVPRSDVLDTETDPLAAEQKMAIAIERVQDPKLVPQDKKWTVEIYKSLAQEFIEITQNRNAVAMLELTLRKFPLNRDAPVMQNKVADLYDELSRLAPDGSAAKIEYGAKALEARTKLASYVGTNTPWVEANKDDPEALQTAEQLVRGGLKKAAADHTNFARGYYQRALELNNEGEQRALIEKAITEYKLADAAWAGYLEQDPTALDAYESRFWLADARYWGVVLGIALERSPDPEQVTRARVAAVDVRDSNEDDKYLQPSAYYIVTLADKVLEDEHRKFAATGGKQGIEKRERVRQFGEGDQAKVIRDEVPPAVLATIRARDEYNDRIAYERDPQKNGQLYAFQAADQYFLYGQFSEARTRFQPIYDTQCGKTEWGYKAWEKLVSMAALENDATTSRKLAEAKSCAVNEETRAAEESLRRPVIQGAAYLDARAIFEQAEKMKDGPERTKKWREAAAAYKVALDAAPGNDSAPEAAMNGAYAYKQVGEYDKAIEMYELFIARYGSETTLDKLQRGDPNAQPPVAANPQQYETRVKYLKNAYDALAGSYVLFFNYPRAAETFDKISATNRFKQEERREASRQALTLYSSLGDRTAMLRARQNFVALGASPKEVAEADFIVASAELKRWDRFSPDTGANANARRGAMRAMDDYYEANKSRDPAAQYVVQAAYWSAVTRQAVNSNEANKFWQNTIAAFDKWQRMAPREGGKNTALGSQEAKMAAEGEFTMLDREIEQKFDYETGHHRFKGTTVEVVKQYTAEAATAKGWFDKLQHISDAYVSPEWTIAAISRQGSLYDSLRTGLYNVRPPALKMFDAKTEALLKRAENSDDPDLQAKADEVRVQVQEAWRKKRDQELDSADKIMVDRYATSVTLARRYNVSNPAVVRAIRRLAFMTEVIGEVKMKQFTSTVKELGYTEGMFQRMRPGQVSAPPPQGLPEPLPVIVGGAP